MYVIVQHVVSNGVETEQLMDAKRFVFRYRAKQFIKDMGGLMNLQYQKITITDQYGKTIKVNAHRMYPGLENHEEYGNIWCYYSIQRIINEIIL